jgi:ARG/rhodanese/phosphatase superfamily protein
VIADYLAAFERQPGQVGVIYRIGGVLAGLDLFGSERTFARAFPKLVRGSALQALAGYEKDGQPTLDELHFLRTALAAPADRFPAVGLGEELRIDTDGMGGGALHLDSGLVHLFAFARRPALNKGM